jgi:hypothetical protein
MTYSALSPLYGQGNDEIVASGNGGDTYPKPQPGDPGWHSSLFEEDLSN